MQDEKRTLSQNDALHLWLTQIANLMRERGMTMRQVQKAMENYDAPVTMESLKEDVWKKIQFALFKTTSTKELKKSEKQIDDIVMTMVGIFSKPETHNITLPPFPSLESKNFNETYN
jgi:predicted RNase H-like nuclease